MLWWELGVFGVVEEVGHEVFADGRDEVAGSVEVFVFFAWGGGWSGNLRMSTWFLMWSSNFGEGLVVFTYLYQWETAWAHTWTNLMLFTALSENTRDALLFRPV